jgi:hypothetical protein
MKHRDFGALVSPNMGFRGDAGDVAGFLILAHNGLAGGEDARRPVSACEIDIPSTPIARISAQTTPG